MKIKTSNRLKNFEEYIFAQFNRKLREQEAQTGKKVLSFGIGSPDIAPSKIYLDKFCAFAREPDAHLYPGYGARKEFEEALINWHKTRFGVEITGDELWPLLGAKDGVSHLALALLDAGDEFLAPDPGYPSYGASGLMVGAKPVFYGLVEKNNFKLDLAELEKKATSKTKFIWVNFPSNPIGQVASLEELNEIVAWAKKRHLMLVYDNAYSEITFDGFRAPSILEVPGAKEIAVEIGSFSKSFSFAGYRMGWIVGNQKIVKALAKVKSQIDSGLSAPLQKLGAYALNNPDQNWIDKTLESYKNRFEKIGQYLETLGLSSKMPKGSMYIWAKIPKGRKSEEFCLDILKQKNILLTPGTAFGKNGEGYIRASVCIDAEQAKEYFE